MLILKFQDDHLVCGKLWKILKNTMTHLFFEEECSSNNAVNNQDPIQEVADDRLGEKTIYRTNKRGKYSNCS